MMEQIAQVRIREAGGCPLPFSYASWGGRIVDPEDDLTMIIGSSNELEAVPIKVMHQNATFRIFGSCDVTKKPIEVRFELTGVNAYLFGRGKMDPHENAHFVERLMGGIPLILSANLTAREALLTFTMLPKSLPSLEAQLPHVIDLPDSRLVTLVTPQGERQ